MRKLTSEEFFEKVDIWYNDEDGTLTLKYEGNMAWVVDGTMVQHSNDNIMVFSNHQHNKKIFMNTGNYDFLRNMDDNLHNTNEAYKRSMQEIEQRIESMSNINVDVCNH